MLLKFAKVERKGSLHVGEKSLEVRVAADGSKLRYVCHCQLAFVEHQQQENICERRPAVA